MAAQTPSTAGATSTPAAGDAGGRLTARRRRLAAVVTDDSPKTPVLTTSGSGNPDPPSLGAGGSFSTPQPGGHHGAARPAPFAGSPIYYGTPPIVMHAPQHAHSPFYGPGPGVHPGAHGQFYTPGLGLSRREREVWDVLMPVLAQAHVPPGPAAAVAQAVLADASFARGRFLSDPAYRFRVVIDAARVVNCPRAANVDPMLLGAVPADRDVHTATADNSAAWTSVISPTADILVSTSVSAESCAYQGGITQHGVGCASTVTVGGTNCRHHTQSGAAQRQAAFGNTAPVPKAWVSPVQTAGINAGEVIAALERQVADLTADLSAQADLQDTSVRPGGQIEQLEREVRALTAQMSASVTPTVTARSVQSPEMFMHRLESGPPTPHVHRQQASPQRLATPQQEHDSRPVTPQRRPMSPPPLIEITPAGRATASASDVLHEERRLQPWVPAPPGAIPRRQTTDQAHTFEKGTVSQFENLLSEVIGTEHQGFLELPPEPAPGTPAYAQWLDTAARVYGDHSARANQGRYAWEEELALKVGMDMLRAGALTAARRDGPQSYRQLIDSLRRYEGQRPTALTLQQQRLELLGYTVPTGTRPLKIMDWFNEKNEAIESDHGLEHRVSDSDFAARLLDRTVGFWQEKRYCITLEVMLARLAAGGEYPTVAGVCTSLHEIWRTTKSPEGRALHVYVQGATCTVCTLKGHHADDCWSMHDHAMYKPSRLPRNPAASAAVRKFRALHADAYRKADEKHNKGRGGGKTAVQLELEAQNKFIEAKFDKLNALLAKAGVPTDDDDSSSDPPETRPTRRTTKKKQAKLSERVVEAGALSSLMLIPFMLLTMVLTVIGGSKELLRPGEYTAGTAGFADEIDDLLFNGVPAGSMYDGDPDYPVMWDSGYTGSALVPTGVHMQDIAPCTNVIALGDGSTPIISTHAGDVYYRMPDTDGLQHMFVRRAEVNPSVPFPIFGTHAENHRAGEHTGDQVSLDQVPALRLRDGPEFFGCYRNGMPWMPVDFAVPTAAEREALDHVRVGTGVASIPVPTDALHASMTPTPGHSTKRRDRRGPMRSLQLDSPVTRPPPRRSARVRVRGAAAKHTTAVPTANHTAITLSLSDTDSLPESEGEGVDASHTNDQSSGGPPLVDISGVPVTVGDTVSTYWRNESTGPTAGVFTGTVLATSGDQYTVRYPDEVCEHLVSESAPMRLSLVRRRAGGSQGRGRGLDRATSALRSDTSTTQARSRGRSRTSAAPARHRESAPRAALRNASALAGREVRFETRRKAGSWRRPVQTEQRDNPWSQIAHQLHVAWGHCSMETVMQACSTMGIDIPQADLDRLCRECAVRKSRRRGRRRGPPLVPEPPPMHYGDRLCADIVHERVASTRGNKYWLLIVDEKGRYPYTCPLKRKRDAIPAFRQYCRRHLSGRATPGAPQRRDPDPTDAGKPQTLLKTDNDTVFLSAEFEEQVLNSYSIRLRCGRPNARNDNPICERMVQTIRDRKDTMLESASIDVRLWEHALRWATYLTALLPTKALEGLSPHHDILGQQGLSEQAYVLGRAVPFGTTAYPFNHGRGNHDAKAKIGVFVGINPTSLCPMILKEDNSTVVETTDCHFVLETSYGHPYSRHHPTAYHYHDDPAEAEVRPIEVDSSDSDAELDGGEESATTVRPTEVDPSDEQDSSASEVDPSDEQDSCASGPSAESDSAPDGDTEHHSESDSASDDPESVEPTGPDMLLQLIHRYGEAQERRPWSLDQEPTLGPTRDGFDTPGMTVPDGNGDAVHVSTSGGFADTVDPPSQSRYDNYPDDDSGAFFAAMATGRTPPPGTTKRPQQRVQRRTVCGIVVPRSYAEARAAPEWDTIWKPAFERERDNMRRRGIWRFARSGTAASRGHYHKI